MTHERRWVFVTHPNVAIDPAVPVTRWPLSERGRARMQRALRQPWVRDVRAVHCSTEQKAIDGAALLAEHLGLGFTTHEALGENDRSSTGYLAPPDFERAADAFFAEPERSEQGWARAVDAQRRIVDAVQAIDRSDGTLGTIAIVSHGAVGTLLQCWLAQRPISRAWDQPGQGGGHWFGFTLRPAALLSPWRAIDDDDGEPA